MEAFLIIVAVYLFWMVIRPKKKKEKVVTENTCTACGRETLETAFSFFGSKPFRRCGRRWNCGWDARTAAAREREAAGQAAKARAMGARPGQTRQEQAPYWPYSQPREPCARCGDTRYVEETVSRSCSSCGGSGRTYGNGQTCFSCGGTGTRMLREAQLCMWCSGR